MIQHTTGTSPCVKSSTTSHTRIFPVSSPALSVRWMRRTISTTHPVRDQGIITYLFYKQNSRVVQSQPTNQMLPHPQLVETTITLYLLFSTICLLHTHISILLKIKLRFFPHKGWDSDLARQRNSWNKQKGHQAVCSENTVKKSPLLSSKKGDWKYPWMLQAGCSPLGVRSLGIHWRGSGSSSANVHAHLVPVIKERFAAEKSTYFPF